MGLLPFEEKKRKLIVKRESVSNFGINPSERDINALIQTGIINLNKPCGPSSHQATSYVRDILELTKAGHSGTLDPIVSGVLPIALEKSTKITNVLLNAGKEYVCLMILHADVSEDKIRAAIKEFLGTIEQLPPVRSAVKRQLRKREIYYIEILEIEDRYVLFKVGCEAGTYIRKLVHDLGLKLKCGANMAELIRTRIGSFSDENWCGLVDLKDAYEEHKKGNSEKLKKLVFPVEKAADHLGKVYVADNAIMNLIHGSDLFVNGIVKLDSEIEKGETVAVMSLKNELVCVGEAKMSSDEMVKSEKGMAIDCKKVFMSA